MTFYSSKPSYSNGIKSSKTALEQVNEGIKSSCPEIRLMVLNATPDENHTIEMHLISIFQESRR